MGTAEEISSSTPNADNIDNVNTDNTTDQVGNIGGNDIDDPQPFIINLATTDLLTEMDTNNNLFGTNDLLATLDVDLDNFAKNLFGGNINNQNILEEPSNIIIDQETEKEEEKGF